MKTNRPSFITENDWQLLTKKYKNMRPIIRKIKNNYPIQYLIGNVDFYGYEILVKKGVLIPRFETEGLLEKTMEYIKKYHLEDSNVLDIGTGSGCISIVLKKEFPSLNITAIDKSYKALKIAKKNVKKNHVDINLIRQNIFKYNPLNKYDIIISNPPYIAYDEKIDEACKYEPKMSLYANNNGLEFYEYIIKNSKKYLQEKSILAFEIGYKHGEYLKTYAKKYYPNASIEVLKDLANKDRYFFIINE